MTISRKEKGFTLIELLIVMVILGLLAAMVGPRMFGKVGKSKQKAAKAQIALLETGLDTYRLDVGKYPHNAAGTSGTQGETGRRGKVGRSLPSEGYSSGSLGKPLRV